MQFNKEWYFRHVSKKSDTSGELEKFWMLRITNIWDSSDVDVDVVMFYAKINYVNST